jgi:GPI mannosyltransferase 3
VTSPWNWFTLTRTFSNSLETTLTAGAFFYWPWPALSALPSNSSNLYPLLSPLTVSNPSIPPSDHSRLSLSLFLASLSVLLRPTSIITFLLLLPQSLSPTILLHAIIIGPTTLLAVLVLDTAYFGRPTFPPYNFLKFNFLEELSIFYGSMPWHYYLSQGLPMILTTFLPFTLHGLSGHVISIYSLVIGGVILAFSMIKHKEARFISPLSPLCLLFAGYSISRVSRRWKRVLVPGILVLNMGIAWYLSRVHQSGVISVIHFLREDVPRNGSVGFLMPCYSTPWQSYLQRPDIDAWKLSCDPPLTYVPLWRFLHFVHGVLSGVGLMVGCR